MHGDEDQNQSIARRCDAKQRFINQCKNQLHYRDRNHHFLLSYLRKFWAKSCTIMIQVVCLSKNLKCIFRGKIRFATKMHICDKTWFHQDKKCTFLQSECSDTQSSLASLLLSSSSSLSLKLLSSSSSSLQSEQMQVYKKINASHLQQLFNQPYLPSSKSSEWCWKIHQWCVQVNVSDAMLRFVSFRMKNIYWSDADTVHDIQIQMQSDDQCLYFIINYEWQFRRMDPNTKLRLKQCNHPVYMKLCLYAKIHHTIW